MLIYPRPSDNVLRQLLVVAGSHVSGHLSGNLIVICITFILWHILKSLPLSQQSSLFCLCLVVECCHGKIILLKGKVRWHQCLGMLSLKMVALISFCKSLEAFAIRTLRPYCKCLIYCWLVIGKYSKQKQIRVETRMSFIESVLGHATSQTRLQLNLVFAFTKLSGCDLWPTVNSPRQGALVQPHTMTGYLPQSWLNWKRTLKDTEVRHIRHTQKNVPWLRTLSAHLHAYLPPPTCRVMHLCCSTQDGIFRLLPQNNGCFIFIYLIWFEIGTNSINNHVPFMAHILLSVIILAHLPLISWVEEPVTVGVNSTTHFLICEPLFMFTEHSRAVKQ